VAAGRWRSGRRRVASHVALKGTVASFDEHVGLGVIRASDGRELLFHCTQLVDGTRSIAVGALVRFEVVAGHAGKWEAARVEKL
jgi:cold shock CspA family protein